LLKEFPNESWNEGSLWKLLKTFKDWETADHELLVQRRMWSWRWTHAQSGRCARYASITVQNLLNTTSLDSRRIRRSSVGCIIRNLFRATHRF